MSLFLLNTQTQGLPPGLLESICYIESKHTATAIHHDDGGSNSVGICQIKLSTAKWLGFKGNEKKLMIPSINIFYAALYLKKLSYRYKNDWTKVIIAYNMGSAKFKKTKYSDKVNKYWDAYKPYNKGEQTIWHLRSY